jgi:hypothetical protein
MVIPMTTGDFIDTVSDGGWVGVIKYVPAITGISIGTYPYREKAPQTEAQKLLTTRLRIRRGPPSNRTEEEEEDQSDLRYKLQDELGAIRDRIREQVAAEKAAGKPHDVERETLKRYHDMLRAKPEAQQWIKPEDKAEWARIADEIDKAVALGKLKPKSPDVIARDAALERIQRDIKASRIVDALDAYELMTPEEKALTRDILIAKGPTIKNLELPLQAAVTARFEKLLGQKPPSTVFRKPSAKWFGAYKSTHPTASPTP